MSKFVSKVILLFASVFSFFNLSFTSKADDENPTTLSNVDLARRAIDDLLCSDRNVDVYRVIYRFNSNKCFIMGKQRFLRWNSLREKCQWTRFHTFKQYLHEHLWTVSDFPDVRLLSSDEIASLASSLPDIGQYIGHFYHSNIPSLLLRSNTLT